MRSYLTLSADDVRTGEPLAAKADAYVVDLGGGDGGEPTDDGRDAVAAWLPDADPAQVWVRISPGPLGHDLVRDLVGAGLRRICVGRTESVVQLDALDAVLSTVEHEAGLPPRVIAVAPVLESAAGVLAAPVGPPPLDADPSRLRGSTEALRRAGFRGRGCTSADEVAVVNEVFGPLALEESQGL